MKRQVTLGRDFHDYIADLCGDVWTEFGVMSLHIESARNVAPYLYAHAEQNQHVCMLIEVKHSPTNGSVYQLSFAPDNFLEAFL